MNNSIDAEFRNDTDNNIQGMDRTKAHDNDSLYGKEGGESEEHNPANLNVLKLLNEERMAGETANRDQRQLSDQKKLSNMMVDSNDKEDHLQSRGSPVKSKDAEVIKKRILSKLNHNYTRIRLSSFNVIMDPIFNCLLSPFLWYLKVSDCRF